MADSQTQDSSTATNKWSEIIEDLWKYLPHFQDEEQLYDENCLKFDCIKLQFGDGEESESDDIPWVQCDLPSIEESTDGHLATTVTQIESKILYTLSLCVWILRYFCIHFDWLAVHKIISHWISMCLMMQHFNI